MATTRDAAAFDVVPGVRIPYVRRCVLWRGGRRVDATLCNLSVLGVYLTFPRPTRVNVPQPGEIVHIAFLLPGDQRPVGSAALVTWQNLAGIERFEGLPPGCGLRFTSLSSDDHHRIGEVVHDYQHAEHPRIAVTKPESGFTRMPCVQPCLVEAADRSLEGILCNLSLVGAYVSLEGTPPVGTPAHLRFHLGNEEPLEVRCEVAWINGPAAGDAAILPPGCGLRFIDLDDALRARLEAMIAEFESLPRVLRGE